MRLFSAGNGFHENPADNFQRGVDKEQLLSAGILIWATMQIVNLFARAENVYPFQAIATVRRGAVPTAAGRRPQRTAPATCHRQSDRRRQSLELTERSSGNDILE